ncbi:MAG: TonB family protein, partial [Sphingobacteriaceae bacterium]
MLKPTITLCLIFIIVFSVKAQQVTFRNDTSVYTVKKSKIQIDNGDSISYTRFSYPAGTKKGLHGVKEYYASGKLKFSGASYKEGIYTVLDGLCIDYFANGNKKLERTYENGLPVEPIYFYYPNGSLHSKKLLQDDLASYNLLVCKDSTGATLTEKGTGLWIEYDDDFKDIVSKGQVKNGKKEGEWISWKADGTQSVQIFKAGQLVSGKLFDKNGKEILSGEGTVIKNDFSPLSKYGLQAFANYIKRGLRYPETARQHEVTGVQVISMCVEPDGVVSDVKMIRSVGSGCEEAATRVITASSPWTPGYHNGKPVRVKLTFPIGYYNTINGALVMPPLIHEIKTEILAEAAKTHSLKDTVIAFLTYDGTEVSTINSADYVRAIYPPNETEKLFTIKEVYTNGRPKFSGKSADRSNNALEGTCMWFYPNGKVKSMGHYEGGREIGEVSQYYPNGRLYGTIDRLNTGIVFYKDCRDSTGKIYAANGNGEWRDYTEDYSQLVAKGRVFNGRFDGDWEYTVNDDICKHYTAVYKDGNLVSGIGYDNNENAYPFTESYSNPAWSKGMYNLGRYLSAKLIYPQPAVISNISGTVMVSFLVKKDGTLADFKVDKSLGYGCDEAAVATIKTSKDWIPAKKYGIPQNRERIFVVGFLDEQFGNKFKF